MIDLPMCECATEYEGNSHHPQCPVRRRMETDAERIRLLAGAVQAVSSLIDESNGVSGLHLNGDFSPWEELMAGGRFEEWLLPLSNAIDWLSEESKT